MRAAARRSLAFVGPAVAAAVVFSPLVAAVGWARLDRAALADAFNAARRPLGHSLAVAGVAAVVGFGLGLPFALAVERAVGRTWRRALWAMAVLALVVPPYIVGESAIVLLGPAGKLSRGLALLAGLGPPAGDALARARFTVGGFIYDWRSAGAVLGACFFPVVALAVAAAYRRTDGRVFEAARLARGRRGVWSVGAALLVPPAAGAALLVFAAALSEAVVPQLLRVPNVGEAVYERIQEGDLATAAALGLSPLPVIALAGALGAFILVRARAASLAGLEGEVPDYRAASAREQGGARNAVAGAVAAVALAPALGLPAISLAWLAIGSRVEQVTAGSHRVLRASGFLEAMRGAWELAGGDAARTVALAAFTATVATAAAVLIARPLVRSRSAWVLGVLGAGLAVPPPVVGLGLIALWNRPGPAGALYATPAIVVLGWLARFLPVAVLLAQAALARVPRELEEAAALAGRGRAARMTAVVLPAAAPGLLAAWLATYVLSATEFIATLLVSPPGVPLLAPSVVNLIRRGQDPQIAACQLLLLTAVAAPLAAVGLGALARARIGATRRQR